MNSFLKRTSIVLMSSGAALAFALTSANAADPIIYEQPPVMMPAAMYDWSGFYAGIAAGYGTGDADYDVFDDGTGIGGDRSALFLLGGVVGYNYQAGAWVFGVEGDLFWSGIDGSTADFGTTIDSEIEWMGSVRGRVGYAFDNILPYLTAGVAFANNDVSVGGFGSDDNTHIGWTAGVGVEIGLTQNLSTSLEYRYTDFGSEDYGFEDGFSSEGSGDLHTVGVALKWRFGM